MRWTIRGRGLQLYPQVIAGPGFEDEDEMQVVAVDALLSAIRGDLALHDNTGDPLDEGYKLALADIEAILAAALSEEEV